ncbi:family 78 glycoside hydrolase catalytic domain [Streptomyces sp. NPDC005921]|uniref:family 78 glycoside hydrolase catalytic domain n=1 Tax=Streptomyces sp. NPDC005827 TaxID=3157070 RepID=UPI0033E8C755
MTRVPTRLSAGEQPGSGVLADPAPTLSWFPPVGLPAQTAYEVQAHVDDLAPRVWRTTGTTPRATWPWEPIPSRSHVTVRVRVADGYEWSSWSELLSLRAPLWKEGDWASRWISPRNTASGVDDRGAWDVCTTFELGEIPSSAWLYATALGVYEVAINSVRVGDVELTPGFSTYDETLYAQAYNVADLLRPGTNTIVFTVSDGWYRGRNGGRQVRDVWGDTLGVRAQLEAGDLVVATGAGWTARPSLIIRADLMRGQATDFRIRQSAAPGTPVLVDAVTAPTPSWSPAPPVRRAAQWRPRSVTELRPGLSIVDAGQNVSGWLRLRNLGRPGERTTLEYGEHLDPDGDLTTKHLDMTAYDGRRITFGQVDEVAAGAGDEVFEPRHTIHGFRYVRVTHPGRSLSADDITVVAVHTGLDRRGWFECSSPELDELHRAADWSFRGNVVDVPTDCPTRERSGWTGDYGLFAPVAARLYDIDGFSRKWLRSVRDDQFDDGVPAMFSPDTERTKHHPHHPGRRAGGSAGWGDALIDVPWTLYTEYGDPKALAECWDSMTAWIGYALRCARELRHPSRIDRSAEAAPHQEYVWDAPFHFGEWCEPRRADDLPQSIASVLTQDQGEVATAYLHRSLSRLSAVAAVLGKADAAERYAAVAERVLDAWQREFLDHATGHTAADTQAGYVRALSFGLLPEALRPAAADRLVTLIHENDDRLTTGFLTSGLLLPVLADTGHADVAYRLLLRRGVPSWLGMLDRGATTVWEEWEGVDRKGNAHGSLNHYSKGAVIEFLHRHVAGLRQHPSSAGWEYFTVHPVPGGGLTAARLLHLSPRGPIEVGWTRDGRHFALDVEIPPTTTATVVLPDGTTLDRGPGRHRFTCETNED